MRLIGHVPDGMRTRGGPVVASSKPGSAVNRKCGSGWPAGAIAHQSASRWSADHKSDQLQSPQAIYLRSISGGHRLPEARGEATVRASEGVIKIDASQEKLQPPPSSVPST